MKCISAEETVKSHHRCFSKLNVKEVGCKAQASSASNATSDPLHLIAGPLPWHRDNVSLGKSFSNLSSIVLFPASHVLPQHHPSCHTHHRMMILPSHYLTLHASSHWLHKTEFVDRGALSGTLTILQPIRACQFPRASPSTRPVSNCYPCRWLIPEQRCNRVCHTLPFGAGVDLPYTFQAFH